MQLKNANVFFSFTLSEKFPPFLPFGQLFVHLNGSDSLRFDVVEAATIELPLVAPQFSVDSLGRISLLRPLDYETQRSHELSIGVHSAYETTRPPTNEVSEKKNRLANKRKKNFLQPAAAGRATIRIEVRNELDNALHFEWADVEAPIRIDERTPRGSCLRSLRVHDAENVGALRFSLLVGDE